MEQLKSANEKAGRGNLKNTGAEGVARIALRLQKGCVRERRQRSEWQRDLQGQKWRGGSFKKDSQWKSKQISGYSKS